MSIDLFRPLLISLLPILILSACGKKQVERNRITLQELAEYPSFVVTVEGDSLRSYLTGDTVVYSEWAYGEVREGHRGPLVSSYQSNSPITLVTPWGITEIDLDRLRPHLGIDFSRTFNKGSRELAPAPLRPLIDQSEGSVLIAEYKLVPSREYHVKVERQEIELSDSVGFRYLIRLSDLPFDSTGAPKRNLTPAYGGR